MDERFAHERTRRNESSVTCMEGKNAIKREKGEGDRHLVIAGLDAL